MHSKRIREDKWTVHDIVKWRCEKLNGKDDTFVYKLNRDDYQREEGQWPANFKNDLIITILNPPCQIDPIKVEEKSWDLYVVRDKKWKRNGSTRYYGLINGLQRTSTLVEFYNNEFQIGWKGTKKFFKDLKKKQQDTFLSFQFRIDVYEGFSEDEIIKVFLNCNNCVAIKSTDRLRAETKVISALIENETTQQLYNVFIQNKTKTSLSDSIRFKQVMVRMFAVCLDVPRYEYKYIETVSAYCSKYDNIVSSLITRDDSITEDDKNRFKYMIETVTEMMNLFDSISEMIVTDFTTLCCYVLMRPELDWKAFAVLYNEQILKLRCSKVPKQYSRGDDTCRLINIGLFRRYTFSINGNSFSRESLDKRYKILDKLSEDEVYVEESSSSEEEQMEVRLVNRSYRVETPKKRVIVCTKPSSTTKKIKK